MTASAPAPKSRILSARRFVLLAGVAGLSVAVLGGADLVTKATGPALSTIAYAQGVQRPMGFADIVEKVKPAVISVRVKARRRSEDDGHGRRFAGRAELADGAVLPSLRHAGHGSR